RHFRCEPLVSFPVYGYGNYILSHKSAVFCVISCPGGSVKFSYPILGSEPWGSARINSHRIDTQEITVVHPVIYRPVFSIKLAYPIPGSKPFIPFGIYGYDIDCVIEQALFPAIRIIGSPVLTVEFTDTVVCSEPWVSGCIYS